MELIHGKWIYTDKGLLENHVLAIKDNLIFAILPLKECKERFPEMKIENHTDHLIIPGFINCHTHLGMNFFRGLADDLSLMNWLNHHVWPAEAKWLSDEFVYDASLLAMAEMIRGGTICFNDMYFFLDAIAGAAEKAGMRAFIGMTILEFPTAWAKTIDEYFAKALDFLPKYQNHPLIKPTFAPHAIYTVAEKNLIKVKELAEEYQLKINMHVQETADEVNQSLKQTGLRPLKRLEEIDFISPRLIAIHMTQLNDEDLTILHKKQPHIVHCPESNMKLASGACPVVNLQQLKVNVALGTDGVASNNDLDMLSEMRAAGFLAKLITKNAESLTAEQALLLATQHGAKALGIDHITGTLTPGKSADFIAINLEQIETQPIYHPLSQLIYAASRNQVTDVWVAGKQLLKNRELLTLDEKEILAKSKKWQEKIKNYS